MKYLRYIGLAALALAFTACDDIEDSNSLPQTNPQLPGVDAANVKVDNGEATNSTIDLGQYNEADRTILMATVPIPSDWPEGFTPSVPYVRMAPFADFTTYFDVEATMGADGQVYINPDDFDGEWKDFFGKDPSERKLYLRYPVLAVKGTQSVRMGGPNTWYGEKEISVIPFDIFGHVIEEAYYVVGSFCNWDLSQGIKLNQSGYNQYDDPNFTSPVLNVEGAGYQYVIVPESTVASGSLANGYYGAEYRDFADPAGSLIWSTEANPSDIPAFVINEAGPYTIKFDLAALSYTSQQSFKYLYTPGIANDWIHSLSQPLYTDNYSYYMGYVHLKGKFKFSSALDWKGTNWGLGDTPGTLSTTGGDIPVEEDALYYVTVNLDALTYNLLKIENVGIIGDATPKGWDGQTNMEPSADFLTWTITTDLNAGELKFRFNDNWDYNLGGDLGSLSAGGDNIPVPAAGKYVITLNLASLPYTATITPQN